MYTERNQPDLRRRAIPRKYPETKPVLAAEMTIHDTRRRRGIGIYNQIIPLTDPLNFAAMVIETLVNAFHIGKVGADVLFGNRNPALLHVVGFGEHNIINHVQFVE